MTRMHVDEVAIDAGLVSRLLAAQFPQWASREICFVEPAGTEHAIYRLGDEMMIRLPRTPRVAVQPAIDHYWLPKLAPLLPLRLPVPIALGVPGEDYPWPWTICEWIEGEPATSERLASPTQTASDLAGFVEALQSVDFDRGPAPGPDNSWRGVPLAMRDEPTRASIGTLGAAIDVEAVTAVWDEAVSTPEWNGPPRWLHGDLDARNLIATRGRLCGVIDWGCLVMGDPACDVMVAWKLLTGDARERFRSQLTVDAATWARARGWAISQAVIALAYYTLETNAVLVMEARRWMTEILDEHRAAG